MRSSGTCGHDGAPRAWCGPAECAPYTGGMSASPSTPLAGVKVVEFCQVAAGPFCGMLLADYGAEVIKVEPPEGDAMRQWPPVSSG